MRHLSREKGREDFVVNFPKLREVESLALGKKLSCILVIVDFAGTAPVRGARKEKIKCAKQMWMRIFRAVPSCRRYVE